MGNLLYLVHRLPDPPSAKLRSWNGLLKAAVRAAVGQTDRLRVVTRYSWAARFGRIDRYPATQPFCKREPMNPIADQQPPQLIGTLVRPCLLYTSPSPRDRQKSRMPSSA